MLADLHLHTKFSDGTFTPEELALRGKNLGLAAMAITDHDTVEGCMRMAVACDQAGIEYLTGTELTAEFDGHEVHLLGYGVDLSNRRFLCEVARFQSVRQERIHEMVARLNSVGVPLRAEAVFAIANCRSPGRPHVARALVQAGLCANLDEAFERYLKKNRPAWVPKCKMSALEAIQLIHHAGGVAVLAHPGLNRADQFIEQLAAEGLDGLECFHSKHTGAASQQYLSTAERCDLLVTGGSDCHGMNKGKPLVGSVKVPYEYALKLKEHLAARRTTAAAARSAARPPRQTDHSTLGHTTAA